MKPRSMRGHRLNDEEQRMLTRMAKKEKITNGAMVRKLITDKYRSLYKKK